jgi:Flp pilus assembly protein TadG
MILSSASRKRSSRRGVAAVEFALVAPIFFTVILAIIEFGRMMMVQEVLINAAREGARVATLPGETDTQVANTVNTYLSNAGLTGCGTPGSSSPAVSPLLSTSPASGTELTMTLSISCSTASWLGGSTWFNGKSLSASVTMMKQ